MNFVSNSEILLDPMYDTNVYYLYGPYNIIQMCINCSFKLHYEGHLKVENDNNISCIMLLILYCLIEY